ncbi:hypothetical protein GF389_01525 [Candidatus Dojkabacteria bacterium]|nr:hypothetical protein [Candidatus Dojkabacteria bacterium]
MDVRTQLDLYIKNIFSFLELEDELPKSTTELIRNSVLLESFEKVIAEKFEKSEIESVEKLIEQQNQEALEKVIKDNKLEHDIQKQIKSQFIETLGELLIEMNANKYISDEKMNELIKVLQNPEKQETIFPS